MPTDTTLAPLKGAELIKDQVKRLPDAPGVYRMMGEDGEVLYCLLYTSPSPRD